MQTPCLVLLEIVEYPDNDHKETWCCKIDQSIILPFENLPDGWPFRGIVTSGITTAYLSIAEIKDNSIDLKHQIPMFSSADDSTRRRRLQEEEEEERRTFGNKTVLAVRVKALNRETTSSMDEMRDNLFGTNGDPINLAERYNSCSFGKLRMIPTPDPRANNGIIEVSINQWIFNATRLEQIWYSRYIRNIVSSRLDEILGEPASNVADFVMISLPSGTGPWLGMYACV